MNAIVIFALKRQALMVVALIALLGTGAIAFSKLNTEAHPDSAPPLVDIITQSNGQSAEEIERYITIPIEIQMADNPHVTAVRTISLSSLSDVKVQFTYDFTYEQAKQWVINRLAQLPPLPNGAQPELSPTSQVGDIFRYRLAGAPGYSVEDLKTVQDWILERRFKAVPGVIDVNGWGGKTKTYDIAVDLNRLVGYGLTLQQVLQVLGNSNISVGGQTIDFGTRSAVVRGIGLIHSTDEIRNTMVAANNGAPVLIRDIATVSVGNQSRLGIGGQGDDESIVQGIILMRRGAESLPTLELVQAEIDKINADNLLPPGVQIEKIYDRTELISVTTRAVTRNLVVGIVLIFAAQWIFLGNLRSAMTFATTIPFVPPGLIDLFSRRAPVARDGT